MDDLTVAKKLISRADKAKQRGKPFNLGFREIRRLYSTKKCFFTGVEFGAENTPTARTVDCVDPSKGYVKGNVVACTERINRLKDNFSPTEIKQLYAGLKKKGVL